MAIAFPGSPALNDEHEHNGRTWRWDGDSWVSIAVPETIVPVNVSSLTNDVGYISSYTETDPVFTAWDRSTGIAILESQVTDLQNYLLASHDMTLTLSGDVSGSATFTNMGNATLTVAIADDSHNHTIANVDGLQTALDGKQATGNYLTTATTFGGDVSGTYNAIVIADDSHNHTIANVDGLQSTLDGKLSSTHDMTLTLSGDVSGSATFTNMGNATLNAVVSNDSHSHDTQYLPLYGGTVTGLLTTTNIISNSGAYKVNSNTVSFENDKHFISFNEGGGSFNIRVGNNTAATCTETGYPCHFKWDQSAAFFSINATSASQTASSSISWNREWLFDYVTGDLTVPGTVNELSDERLKTDIATIEGALDKVTALRGVTYVKDGRNELGLIAQEVEQVIPEVVNTANNEDAYKSVSYTSLVGLLVESIKEMDDKYQQRIAELEQRIDELTK